MTSQHFANFYLGWFDRFVKEKLRVRGYVRYMDDCVFWSDEKIKLAGLVDRCNEYLHDELDLDPKPVSAITIVRHGLDFLGCRVYPDHLKLNRRSRRRFRRKLFGLTTMLNSNEINLMEYQRNVTSLLAFTRAGGVKSWKFRNNVLKRLKVSEPWALCE